MNRETGQGPVFPWGMDNSADRMNSAPPGGNLQDAAAVEQRENRNEYLVLMAALNDPRAADDNDVPMLEYVTTLIEQFLTRVWSVERHEKIRRNVNLLCQCGQFLPFLMNVLTNGTVHRTVHQRALWILGAVISQGGKKIGQRLNTPGLNHILLYHLRSPDKMISEQAISTLAQVTLTVSLRCQLLPYASTMFSCLANILKRSQENTPEDELLVKSIANIVSGITIMPDVIHARLKKALEIRVEGQDRAEAFENYVNTHPDVKRHMADMRTMQSAIPVINLLLEVNDKEVRCMMLYCVGIIGRIFTHVKVLIDEGISAKLVTAMSDPDDLVLINAVMALGNLSVKPEKLAIFMNSVHEVGWLKHYWKVIFSKSLESTVQLRDEIKSAIEEFLYGLMSLFTNGATDPTTVVSMKNVIDSGLLYSLAHFMEDRTPMDIKSRAVFLLRVILGVMAPDQRRTFMDSGALKVASLISLTVQDLETGIDLLIRPTAARVLGYLVENCSTRRDEAVAHGVIPILLNLLDEWMNSVEARAIQNLLFAILKIVKQKPRLQLEHIKDIPLTFQKLWKKRRPLGRENISDGFITPAYCLSAVSSCGQEGIDLILEQEDLLPTIKQYLTSSEVAQQAAMSIILEICKGTPAHRQRVLNEHVLEVFPELLKCVAVSTRKDVLDCLYGFICEGLLNNKQRILVRDVLWPLVKVEMRKGISDTNLISVFIHNELTAIFGARFSAV